MLVTFLSSMLLKAKIKDGEIVLDESVKNSLYKFEGKEVNIDITKYKKTRTNPQNRALHLYFSQLAKALNDEGYDMRTFISEGIDIYWSPHNIKEHLWRPTMETMLGIKSTKQMKTGDIDQIYDVINKAVGERTGIHIPFPSIETLMDGEH